MTRTFNLKGILAALVITCCLQSAFAQTFWTESFSDQTASEANWIHGGTNPGPVSWAWTDDPDAGAWDGAWDGPTAATGYFWFDSDGNLTGNTHDVTLTGTGVPADCSAKSNVHVKFYTFFRTISGIDVARVGVSTDGTNFTYYNVPQFDALGAETSSAQFYNGYVDLAIPEADGKSQVWIQFRYQGTWEYYWKVDDIELYEAAGAVPCDQNPLAIICDNFDSYNTAQKLGPQATHWTTWSGGEGTAEDGIVSTEQASTGANSLKVVSTAATGGPQDVVLNLGNKSTGKYELKFKMYIPTGKNGYYNMQQSVPIGNAGAGDWNFNVHFENAGAGRLTDSTDATLGTFTYPYDQWFECRHVFDLDHNLHTFYADGNFVKKAVYYRNLGGIDFFGTNNVSTFYVDDVEYVGLPAVVYNADECDGAIDLSLYFGKTPEVPQTTGLYDNSAATVGVSDPSAPSCFLDGVSQTTPADPEINNSMWFSFTGDGGSYDIQTVPCNATTYVDDTQIAIYTGECGNLVQIACNEDLFPTGDPDFRAGLTNFETEPGVEYLILIDGWSIGGVAASGEYCIEITQKPSVTCADGEVGTFTVANNGFVCNAATTGGLFDLDDASFALPTVGPVYGMAWAITTEAVTGGAWPPSLTSYWGSFGVSPSLYVPNLTNNGNPLTQNAIWYFTPVVVGGAVDTIPANAAFLHQLDLTNACYFVGESVPLILLAELNPLDAVADVTNPTPGNSDGVIDLTVSGGIFDILQDPSVSYTVDWTGPNGFTSSDEDISGLGAGDYTATIVDITGCVDPYDFTVSVVTAVKDPASVKSLTINPNPTSNLTQLNLQLEKTAEVRVEILNTLGQSLQTVDAGKVNTLNQQIDLSRFTEGTYFLRVTVDGETAIRRVVLNR